MDTSQNFEAQINPPTELSDKAVDDTVTSENPLKDVPCQLTDLQYALQDLECHFQYKIDELRDEIKEFQNKLDNVLNYVNSMIGTKQMNGQRYGNTLPSYPSWPPAYISKMYGLDGGEWLQLERELQDDGGDDDTEEKTEAKAIYANVCNDGILQTY